MKSGTGWDGMGWDGMGWDGMGWDGMGWDGMCDRVMLPYLLKALDENAIVFRRQQGAKFQGLGVNNKSKNKEQ